MALEIEDGTGKEDAQSYATVDELVAYAALRGIDLPVDPAARETLLINGIDLLETLDYIGSRNTATQALSWPRTGGWVDGFELPSDAIPRNLKMAQMQLALDSIDIDLLPTAAAPETGSVIEETVEGAVTVKYDKASPVDTGGLVPGVTLARASALVKPLLAWEQALFQVPVGRA